ncbi:hypothetical protein JCM3774_000315 [Rhodotorula dairenensis]
MHKLSAKFDKLTTRAERFGESVAYAWNPDHRHDEAHEKAEDEARLQIRKEHRFESFAGETEGNDVKWYTSGHDYFYALSEIIENAKETVWILDWWLTPELHLRRPPTEHEDFRLDRLLLRKAQQGVKIFIIVYKEVTQTMSMSSAHTKHFLEDLHENIAVVRHPDHLGGEVTLYWSHHEKVVVVDNVVACIGGLDICFGRWDTSSHPLADVHPTDFSRTLFPGQEYNNARVADFKDVDRWASNQQSRLETPRMPWLDVHSMITGPAVLDIAQHFVERWNFVKHLKYRHGHRYPTLAFPHPVDPNEKPTPTIVRHPHWQKFAELGERFTCHIRGPDNGWQEPISIQKGPGTARIQVLRSVTDWSHGVLPTEHSIQNAYLQLIREASHYILIQNQFFVSNASGEKGPVLNVVAAALVERILSAARDGKKFKVVIMIPAIPGFAGDIQGSSGTLAILGAQYQSISRGGKSICELIEKAGFNPHDYIEFYNLRSYDRLNNDPNRLKRMQEKSGISFEQAQAALARVYLGPEPTPQELEKNRVVKFAVPREGAEMAALGSKESVNKADETRDFPLPESFEEAWDIVRRFQAADNIHEEISDTVAHHCDAAGTSLLDEKWSGDEASERYAYVTEETYIHSKLLIADDQRVIMGSANINDRSLRGDRDSEIACVYEDWEDVIESRMDGRPVKVSRFAATLRRQIYKESLGLAPPHLCPPGSVEPISPAMMPVGTDHADVTTSAADQLVTDPLSPETEALLRDTARRNADIYENVFHVVPSRQVETWAQYKAYAPQPPIKPGHIANLSMPMQQIKEQLAQIRGRIVEMPLNFLAKERLLDVTSSEVNPLTLAIYV